MFSWNSLQALELDNLLLQAAVELRVLDGDADVAGQRLQQLHVLAGEEVAFVGAAEADDGDGRGAGAFAIGDAAGKVVVQVERRRVWRCDSGRRRDVLRILEEDMVVGTRAVEVEEAHIERAGPACRLVRPCEAASSKCACPLSVFAGARKTATRVTSSVCGSRSTIESSKRAQIGLRVEAAAKLDQRLAVVEALLIEDAIHPRLNRSASADRRRVR